MACRVVGLFVFAAVLLFAVVGPGLAQEEDGGGDGGATATAGDVQIQYQDCDQVVAAAAEQLNTGDAGAVSGDVSAAAAAQIAQKLGISVGAVQNCLQAAGDIGAGGGGPGQEDTGETPQEEEDGGQADTDGAPTGDEDEQQSLEEMQSQVLADTIPSKVLPVTGGAHPAALLAGALLVTTGLLLLVRRR
ncbi:MAG: LPXTG cell wall anchor domain-containing protein [Rubrobacter sp.]|nr:LPXTG cell wall anchor domain-containing protein [Rubrobacter sp.]